VEHKRTTVMSRFSHDLRTPLHGILGSIGLLKNSVDNEEREQAAELLNTLDAATKEMEKLMNDMLDEESSNRLDQGRRADTNAWAALQAQGQTSAMTPGSSYSTLSTFDFSHESRDALPASPGDPKPLSTPAAGPRPVTQGTAALSPIPEPLTQPNAEDAPKPLSVLVVEDDPVSRKLLAMAVKRAVRGVGVTQARDGVEGLTAFCNAHPHLVLTDVNMPIMDGITAAKAMRTVESAQGWKRCVIYTITGLGQADVQKRRDALNLTLDGWLVKGQHRMEDIQAIVKELHERRKERGDDDVQVDPTRRASR
jgi:CheY-like chemotaxis protein